MRGYDQIALNSVLVHIVTIWALTLGTIRCNVNREPLISLLMSLLWAMAAES